MSIARTIQGESLFQLVEELKFSDCDLSVSCSSSHGDLEYFHWCQLASPQTSTAKYQVRSGKQMPKKQAEEGKGKSGERGGQATPVVPKEPQLMFEID